MGDCTGIIGVHLPEAIVDKTEKKVEKRKLVTRSTNSASKTIIENQSNSIPTHLSSSHPIFEDVCNSSS